MADALATAALRRVQLSWAVSAVGSWAFFVVFAVWAYGEGGAAAVGLAAFARMVPAGLAAPLTGLLVDRRPRHQVLVVGLVLQGAALSAIAAAVAADASLVLVLVLAAAFTVAGTTHRPAQAAMLPTLADSPKQLAAANAVWSAIDSAAFLGGSLLAGTLIALTSLQAAFGTAAALMVLSVVPLARVARDPVPAHRGGAAAQVGSEVAAGVVAIVRDPELRVVVGFLTFATLVEGAVDVLVVVAAISLLGMGEAGVGILNAFWGVGGLAGGLAALTLLARGRLALGLAGGGLLVGGALAVIAWSADTAAACAALVVLGVGYVLIESAGVSLLQRLSSEDVIGRAFAAVESGYWLAAGAGALAAPLLVDALGVRGALVAVGAALVLVVLARRTALVRLEAGAPVPERAFAVLRAQPLFAPLAIGTVEVLARRAHRVDLAPGEVLIREGDHGDRLYVVVEGEIAVTCAGRELGRRGAGEVVGEIALLRDVPRTATVVATSATELLALDRDSFLLAVGAHQYVRSAADDLAGARLRELSHTP